MNLEKQNKSNIEYSDNNNDLDHNLLRNHEEYLLALEVKIAGLKELCQDLDPYSPLTDLTKSKLQAFGIKDLENPFTITNQLLLLLENAISEQLKLRLKN